MKLSLPTVLFSLLLHGVLLALLWLFGKPAKLPEPPQVMQAVLMTLPASAAPSTPPAASPPSAPPVPKPSAPEPQAPVPKKPEPPKPEPKKPAVVTPQPQKAEPKKPEPSPKPPQVKTEPVRTPPEKDAELDEVENVTTQVNNKMADQAKLANELSQADAIATNAANERARRMSAQIGEFQLAINRKIKSNWRRPSAVAGKLVTELRITLLPGGEVASVVVVKSSGNAAFDESAKDAVNRANPLPVPADPVLFREQFKVLLLKFKPEE